MKASGVRYLVNQGIENIWKNRMMAFASFCVLLASLLLVGISVLFYMNITSMIGGVEDKNEVIVYLDEDTTDSEISEFKASCKSWGIFSRLHFIPENRHSKI